MHNNIYVLKIEQSSDGADSTSSDPSSDPDSEPSLPPSPGAFHEEASNVKIKMLSKIFTHFIILTYNSNKNNGASRFTQSDSSEDPWAYEYEDYYTGGLNVWRDDVDYDEERAEDLMAIVTRYVEKQAIENPETFHHWMARLTNILN